MDFMFNELSTGQRALVVLYTLLNCLEEDDTALLIDEPDNFVAVEEIQPWLLALRDRIDRGGLQALLISHHPELLNYLARESGIRLFRQCNSPTRVAPFGGVSGSTLTPAEQVARGWVDE